RPGSAWLRSHLAIGQHVKGASCAVPAEAIEAILIDRDPEGDRGRCRRALSDRAARLRTNSASKIEMSRDLANLGKPPGWADFLVVDAVPPNRSHARKFPVFEPYQGNFSAPWGAGNLADRGNTRFVNELALPRDCSRANVAETKQAFDPQQTGTRDQASMPE